MRDVGASLPNISLSCYESLHIKMSGHRSPFENTMKAEMDQDPYIMYVVLLDSPFTSFWRMKGYGGDAEFEDCDYR